MWRINKAFTSPLVVLVAVLTLLVVWYGHQCHKGVTMATSRARTLSRSSWQQVPIRTCHQVLTAPLRNFYLKPLTSPPRTPETQTGYGHHGNSDHHGYTISTDPERPLVEAAIPLVFHFVWCAGAVMFEFSQFLSVAAVVRLYAPDLVVLHYDVYPAMDLQGYNTWLEELRQQFPFLTLSHNPAVCHEELVDEVVGLLRATGGGYYVSLGVVLLRNNLLRGQSSSFVAGNSGVPDIIGIRKQDVKDWDYTRQKWHHGCINVTSTTSGPTNLNDSLCVILPQNTTPRDLLAAGDGDAGTRHAQWILYGQDSAPEPVRHSRSVVPHAAHYVWYGGRDMDYTFYLSVLSVLYVGQVDVVYLHGERQPGGALWTRLQLHAQIRWLYRPLLELVYQTSVSDVKHAADIARGDIMFKYGGILMDPNVVLYQAFDPKWFYYDAVVSLDNYKFPSTPFPDVLSLGVALGRPGAEFWRMYRDSQRMYDDDFIWNSGRVPYKIYERNPDTILIAPRLQVICYDLVCCPTWISSIHRQDALRLHGSMPQWRGTVTSFHWTGGNPDEFGNESILRKAMSCRNMSTFSLVGKRVLEKAGLL